MWAFPEEGSIKMNLEEVYTDYGRHGIVKYYPSATGMDLYLESVDYVFVSDMFSEQFLGGAELSLQTLIDECPSTKSKFNSAHLTKILLILMKAQHGYLAISHN